MRQCHTRGTWINHILTTISLNMQIRLILYKLMQLRNSVLCTAHMGLSNTVDNHINLKLRFLFLQTSAHQEIICRTKHSNQTMPHNESTGTMSRERHHLTSPLRFTLQVLLQSVLRKQKWVNTQFWEKEYRRIDTGSVRLIQ
jgi:hypothetical protein